MALIYAGIVLLLFIGGSASFTLGYRAGQQIGERLKRRWL